VLATIRGSAVNQDGASNGLTAPNGPSQERVIRQALANAGLKPAEVEMVEAHGTGTALGDPIEAGALLATYGQEREAPVRLGSLKSNIGHAQAAAGVAGVIKAVLAMREGVMPKTLHVDAPSSKVDWSAGKVELLREPLEWEPNGHPRRAGVSSFGATGTNAHLILEEASVAGRDPGPGASAKDPEGPLPFVLSARSPEALAASAQRLAARLREEPELAPADLAYSLATTRAQLERRAVVTCSEREQLLAALDGLARGEQPAGVATGEARPGARLAYLFTGQGSQRPGMGRDLHETHPPYTEALDAACAQIDPLIGRSLAELIFSEPGSPEAELLAHTTYAQPALFATEVALYRLLEDRGLAPDLLCGHSVGEIAAAHVAGVLSLADAAKLVCARGALMGALPEGGAMLAIEAAEEAVIASIAGREDELSLAAVNSPDACVISGGEGAIAELESHWRGEGKKTKRLEVSHAFHSPLMEPMLAEFGQLARSLAYQEPRLALVSCLDGELLRAERATDPAHWVAHAREPVRFAAAIETLRGEGATALLELGPDPVLLAMARRCLGAEEHEPALAPLLREGRPGAQTLIGALAAAHAAGAPLDWQRFFAATGAKSVPLPTYPFQRRRYWLAPRGASTDPAAIGQRALSHPFLAAAIEDPEGEAISFAGRVSLAQHPWLADHAVTGTVLLPGTAFLELALYTGAEAGTPAVQELTLQAPLILAEAAVSIRVSLSAPDQGGTREIAIHSRAEGDGEAEGWVKHAAGTLGAEQPSLPEPLGEWPPPGAEPIDPADLEARLEQAGFEYGPAFAGLEAAWRRGDELYAEVSLPEGLQGEGFALHPALLD
ncbi:MAG: type I polyketide synthase, partial [Candidatus Nanopelagicales bacterium]